MSRTVINFLLDATLMMVFCALVSSAVIVRFIFPPGPDARGWSLWALTYDHWASLQFALVALLALGILLHVMLHWNWVCGVVATRLARDKKAKLDEGSQTLYGVGLLIVLFNLLGLIIAFAVLSVRSPN
jgi:hypothetical protein